MDIDPEIFNEFQENLKQMSDLLGRNNAAMEQYLNVMNSLDDNNDAIKQNTSANKAGSQARYGGAYAYVPCFSWCNPSIIATEA